MEKHESFSVKYEALAFLTQIKEKETFLKQEERDVMSTVQRLMERYSQPALEREGMFSAIKAEYTEIKKLIQSIDYQKNHITTYDNLPGKVRAFFIEEARRQYQKERFLSPSEAS